MAWILEYMPRQEKTHTLHTHIVIFMLDVFVRFRVLYCLHNFLACFSIIRFATLYCFSSGENIYINSHKLLELLVKKGNRSFSTKANTQTTNSRTRILPLCLLLFSPPLCLSLSWDLFLSPPISLTPLSLAFSVLLLQKHAVDDISYEALRPWAWFSRFKMNDIYMLNMIIFNTCPRG